jgi:hypothetical protein
MSARAQRLALVLVFHVGNALQHVLKIVDRVSFLLGQRCRRMKMRQQHDKRIADAAELLAVACHVRENVSLDRRLARLADRHVEPSDLASERRHERRPWADRPGDVSR